MVDRSGELAGYLFCVWQFLDLHVLKIATRPEFRRRGLARSLMRLAEQHGEEIGGETITLEVRPQNTSAAALYRQLGYAMAGRRPGYYTDGEDALIMSKRLRDVPQ